MIVNPKLPIIVAPMFLISTPEMIVSSCKSGAMSCIPFANARTIKDAESFLIKIQNGLNGHLNPAPWIVNIITHSSYARFDEELALISKYKPSIVITALGSPKRVVEKVKDYGGKVFADVNSIEYAKKCADSGVDGLVLLCSGAGGHTGNLSPFVFVNEVRKFWDGQLVLAGGISNGKNIKSALALGVDYVYMGTRFIACHESGAHEDYKTMVVNASIDDIITTKAITGVKGNFLKPSLLQHGYNLKDLQDAEIDFKTYNDKSKAWKDVWSAGHGVGSIEKRESIADIIEQLIEEYNEA